MREFHPEEGALLDLESLRAIAAAPNATRRALLASLAPSGGPLSGGLVLRGLQLAGAEGRTQTPGAVQIEAGRAVTIGAGSALVRDGEGVVLAEVENASHLLSPTEPGHRPFLYLELSTRGGSHASHLAFAHRDVVAVPVFDAEPPGLRPGRVLLAAWLPEDKVWANDVCRLWFPDGRELAQWGDRLRARIKLIWEPQGNRGSAHHYASVGEKRLQQQVEATSAIYATRAALLSRPTTTLDRMWAWDDLRTSLRTLGYDTASPDEYGSLDALVPATVLRLLAPPPAGDRAAPARKETDGERVAAP